MPDFVVASAGDVVYAVRSLPSGAVKWSAWDKSATDGLRRNGTLPPVKIRTASSFDAVSRVIHAANSSRTPPIERIEEVPIPALCSLLENAHLQQTLLSNTAISSVNTLTPNQAVSSGPPAEKRPIKEGEENPSPAPKGEQPNKQQKRFAPTRVQPTGTPTELTVNQAALLAEALVDHLIPLIDELHNVQTNEAVLVVTDDDTAEEPKLAQSKTVKITDLSQDAKLQQQMYKIVEESAEERSTREIRWYDLELLLLEEEKEEPKIVYELPREECHLAEEGGKDAILVQIGQYVEGEASFFFSTKITGSDDYWMNRIESEAEKVENLERMEEDSEDEEEGENSYGGIDILADEGANAEGAETANQHIHADSTLAYMLARQQELIMTFHFRSKIYLRLEQLSKQQQKTIAQLLEHFDKLEDSEGWSSHNATKVALAFPDPGRDRTPDSPFAAYDSQLTHTELTNFQSSKEFQRYWRKLQLFCSRFSQVKDVVTKTQETPTIEVQPSNTTATDTVLSWLKDAQKPGRHIYDALVKVQESGWITQIEGVNKEGKDRDRNETGLLQRCYKITINKKFSETETPDLTELSKEIIDDKSFENLNELWTKVANQRRSTWYVCPVCGFGMQDASRMMGHIAKKHTNERN